MSFISVVTPVYKAEDCIEELYSRLTSSLSLITNNFEIFFVEDCGTDKSWEIISKLAEMDHRVKGIKLSRNFGQHYAITAGLDYCNSEWVVVMDCDLQDLPEEIPNLFNKAIEGFDMVIGRRTNRQDSWLKKTCSYIFYHVFNYFTNTSVDHRIGNFGIYSNKSILNLLKLREQTRSFGLLASWIGFKRCEIDIVHAKRPRGKSSYSFSRSIALAIDSIVAHSNKLLHLSIQLGLLISVSAFIYSIYLILSFLTIEKPITGWTSVMVSIYFSAGLIIGTIGIVGLYIGKIFDEVRDRPLYLIQEMTFDSSQFYKSISPK